MFHHGVEQHQLVSFRVKWKVGMLHRLGIETDEMTLLAKDGSKLIHNAALHTHIIVFGALTDAGKLKLVDAQVQQVVQCKGIGAFQCCR